MTSAGALRTPIEAALVGRLLDRPPTSARLPVGVLTRTENPMICTQKLENAGIRRKI